MKVHENGFDVRFVARYSKYLSFILLCVFLLASCNHLRGKTAAGAHNEAAEKGQRIEEEPRPGDIKVIDGVEYVYAHNVKFMLTPWEPENVWIRKDQYSGGLLGGTRSSHEEKDQDLELLRRRVDKLEQELSRQTR